jgi:hypothetical protein
MITFMVLDTEYHSYNTFDSEDEAREHIEMRTVGGIASKKDFRLFRRQELEIEE